MKIKYLTMGAVLAMGTMLLCSQVMAADSTCSANVQDAIDLEFGAGAGAATRCLEEKREVRVVFQINAACKDTACTEPYAIGNIDNAITDYEVTHGISRNNIQIVAVVHSSGTPVILANGQFRAQVEAVMAKGVKIYYCQNTARSKKVKFADMIPGVEFVTSGVTAIADFQAQGYSYVQP